MQVFSIRFVQNFNPIPALALALAIILLPALSYGESLNIVSFNIRYDNPNDGEHQWPHRRARVASLLQFHEADIAGLQEVLQHQAEELQESLPEYNWFGVGRDDGVNAGEYSPVFYRSEKMQLLNSGTFWLSTTPDVPGSKSWDAAITRIAVWGQFKLHVDGSEFYFFNTHFDHRGEVARVNSASLILSKIREIAGESPVILSGDFNVSPDSEAYQTVIGDLNDSGEISATPSYGPHGTFGGFTVDLDEQMNRIDHLFVSEGIKVSRHGVLSDQWSGRYPSDHLPVLAEIELP